MTERTITIGGLDRRVHVTGPDGAPAVLILLGTGGASPEPSAQVLAERLEAAGLQSFVWRWEGSAPAHEDVAAAIDQLGLRWVNLVGTGDGAAAAWQTAARHFGRVSSLVVLDAAHPAVADAHGAAADASCPAVDVATTLVVWAPECRQPAYATGRHVYSDYRVVEPGAGGGGAEAVAAVLATETVLRSNPW